MINSSIIRPVLTTGQNTKNNVRGFSSKKSSSYLILIIAPIIDAMDGLSSDASYNILPEFNGVTAIYSNKKTNIDILGANKNSFDKSLTIFYINVQ